MANPFLLAGSIYGMTAVILGAFGAHALKAKLDEPLLASYQTAVQYQFWHALALLAVGILVSLWPHSRILQTSGWLFITGTVLFSGSLYLLSLSNLRQLGFLNIGVITPLGGLCLITGWLALCLAVWRN